MSNLSKLEFVALDILGKSYMSWVLDAEIYLDAMGLADAIKDKNQASNQDRAKAMIFLRHHLDECLKMKYLTVKDPVILWNNLKDRYDHLKMVVLPQARYDWTHLRLQDFKSISEYNSTIFRIISQLKLCGDNITDHDMLEKTFTTFHASNMLLQQQYREMGFKRYSELISHVLVAEQHNGLLMKNYESRPTGSCPFPEVNEMNFHQAKRGGGRGPSRGHGRGRGRNFNHGNNNAPKNPPHHQQWIRKEQKHEAVQAPNAENACYRCRGKGHWSRTCRTPKHLVELYQASLKKTEKNAEANFISEDNLDFMHLDVADYLALPDGETSHVIGGESVEM
ncbi:PREDICTED: uncharacterized protein LOC109240783 [Nicotiana attenuata]|uniref:uncharacterized protein LOC109240783 n=1 Tax=Nicotiana attenuata TaxID=49451 RepID=UPI00090583CA|nr:PREDICTED: uncharacterized protein LOC109240783 [Nicotiana attenuata]